MKKILLLLLVSLFFFTLQSCSKTEVDCTTVAYDTSIKAKLGDNFCLPNGKSFLIKSIEDGRCPCNAECIWAGAIFVDIDLIQENEEKISLQINDSKGKLANEKAEGFIPDIIGFTTVDDDGCLPNKAEDFTLEIIVKK